MRVRESEREGGRERGGERYRGERERERERERLEHAQQRLWGREGRCIADQLAVCIITPETAFACGGGMDSKHARWLR